MEVSADVQEVAVH